MEILKQGNLDRIRANLMKRFECNRCGCVFTAASDEYRPADSIASMLSSIEAWCECPCCDAQLHHIDKSREVQRFLYNVHGRRTAPEGKD